MRKPGDRITTPGNAPRHGERLGDILVANALVTPEQLNKALAAQAAGGKRLGQILVEQGTVSEDDIAWALSNQLGYPYVFLNRDIIDGEAVRLLPEEYLRQRHILPILKFGREVTLAMADPTDERTAGDVAARTGLRVNRALALGSNIEAVLDSFFVHGPAAGRAALTPEMQHLQFHLAQALQHEATEIHFDPGDEGQARVRYRVQGVLVDRPAQPAELHDAILRHLRDLTGIADGPLGAAAVPFTFGDARLYLVAAIVSTAAGTAATVTLYPCRVYVPDLVPQGIDGDRILPLRQALQAPRGVVLVGCADRWLRSTLLQALIPRLPGGHVWALETLPVYRRPTIHQTPVRSPGEMLAHLGAAPDVGADLVVVDDASRGDVATAVHEAGRARTVLAGHPQDDAAGLLGQALAAAGPALVASTLRGVLAARGIRLLCPACKQTPSHRGRGRKDRPLFAPRGCEACGFTGFRGRRVLTELWTPDRDTLLQLASGQGADALARVAAEVAPQMRSQGLALIEDGLTSVEELTRVAGEQRGDH